MSRPRIIIWMLLLLLVFSLLPMGTVQAAGTDEIKDYKIDILPQDDGSLLNSYSIDWCVISNALGPLTWIDLGMPNDQFQVVSFAGDVASVKPDNSGFDYKLRIDLSREVNADDCVNMTVQVHQYGMGYLDKNTNEVFFQFTPGWFNDVPVDHLQLTWYMPTDPAQVRSFDPQPTSRDDTQVIWESALEPGEKFKVAVTYDLAAFPNFNPNGSVSPGSTASGAPASAQAPSSSISPENSGTPESSIFPGLSFVLPALVIPCICLILIVVLIVLVFIFKVLSSVGRSYRGGGFFGGYRGGGGWFGGGGGSILGGGGGSSTPSRSGGGSGLFGGRGSSCACVSSGCACACAGGGRAGCSRKGFDVSGLFNDRKEKGG